MTSTEITVRAHKRKKPQKAPDPLQGWINRTRAEIEQRKAIGKVNEFRNTIGHEPWWKRVIGKVL